jgi:hypothetical protein
MSNNLNTIGWAIIGTPDGMQTKNGGCISKFDIGGLVDMNNLVIKPFPNSEILCLFRENRGSSFINYYVLYNHAKEIKTDRPGTFYGSVLVVVNNIIKGDIALQALREMSNHLSTYLTPDQRFTTNISNIELPTPKNLDAIINSLQSISQIPTVGNLEGIVSLQNGNNETLSGFLNFAINPKLARGFSRIYATASKEVTSYVRERGKIILINPENAELKLEIEQLKSDNENLRTAGQSLKREKEINENALNGKVESLNSKVESLQATVKGLEERLLQYGDGNKMNSIIKERERQIEFLNTTITNLKNKVNNAEENYRNEKNKRQDAERNRGYQQTTKTENYVQSSKHSHHHQTSNKESSDNRPKQKGFDYFAEEFMNNPLSIFKKIKFFLILFIVLLGAFGIYKLSTLFTSHDNEDQYSQYIQEEVPIQSTAPQATPQPKEEELAAAKTAANSFFAEAKANNNVYDPNKLEVLLASLTTLGLKADSSFVNLTKISNNFGLTNYAFNDLDKVEYQIQKGDSTIKAIENHIYAIDEKAKNMKGFLPTLRAFNQINTGYKFKAGNNLIYYVPKKDE